MRSETREGASELGRPWSLTSNFNSFGLEYDTEFKLDLCFPETVIMGEGLYSNSVHLHIVGMLL